MQLICSLVSPVSTCACVRLSMLLHTLVHARTFFQFRVACDLSNVFSRSDLGRAVSRGCEATPMHRKLHRATSHFRNCTQSTCNGHALAYKARRVNVHWHVIIFRQLSWYGVSVRQNRTQNRREEKSRRRCGQKCLRQRCSRLLCRSSVESQEHLSHVSNNMNHIIARRIRHP